MGLSEHVFLYCERGRGEALLAEPFNAASNAAFLLAALVALCCCCGGRGRCEAPTISCSSRLSS
jgi:hypothetical protein